MLLNNDNYQLTEEDVFALNELLSIIHSFNFRVASERKLPKTHKMFLIDAPGPSNGVWYTGTGNCIREAVDSWCKRVFVASGVVIERFSKSNKEE